MGAIIRVFAMALLFVAGSFQSAQAVVTINMFETSGGVQFNATGTLDISSLTAFSLSSGQALVGPNQGYVSVGTAAGAVNPNLLDLYNGISGPTTFGTGGLSYASSVSGPLIGISNYGQWLALSNGFYGGAVNSTAFFASTTIAALGMNVGTHTWSWASDSISLVVPGGSTAVPVPAALPLLLSGMGFLGLLGWRRRRTA